MKQYEFDRLLAWTVMNAMNSAIIVEQNQQGRPLTQDEIDDCMKRNHGAADVLVDFLRQNRG